MEKGGEWTSSGASWVVALDRWRFVTRGDLLEIKVRDMHGKEKGRTDKKILAFYVHFFLKDIMQSATM